MITIVLRILLVVGTLIVAGSVLFYSVATWGAGEIITIIVNLATWGILYLANISASGLIDVYENEHKDRNKK